LTLLRDVEEPAEVLNEQAHAVGLEHPANQGPIDFQVSLHVLQRPSNLRETVILADGVQDVRLDQVEERKRRRRT